MKKKSILSAWETRTLDILQPILRDTGFRVLPVLPLKDVMATEKGDVLGKKLREHLMTSHLDFVVANERAEAKFAIEFDGLHHHTKPRQKEADVRKNRLCNLAGLPLWRIDSNELTEYNTSSVLAFMILRFVAWQEERESLEKEIAEYASALDDEQRSAMGEYDVLEPDLDASFRFDIRHPYPGTAELVRRL